MCIRDRFSSDRIASVMDRLGFQEGEMIEHKMISNSIERAQKKVEENNFGIRKRLLEYDDVMNKQRTVCLLYTSAGKVIYPVEPQDGSRTFREIVHQYCKGHPWARFGIDLCIGSEADRPITQRQMMFAPFYLMDAFAGAQITGDSIQRPLVTDSELIVDATPEEDESFWIPTPLQSALLLFILTAAATIYGIRRRTGLWGCLLYTSFSCQLVGARNISEEWM